jgi:diguanylate cyclase (GGDEF)-like protein/PAS domain S-box-containing protein
MSDRVEMLEAALDLIDEGVALLDDQANVLFWNKAATTLTGYLRQDVVARPCPADMYRIDADHRGRLSPSAEQSIDRKHGDASRRFGVSPQDCASRTALLYPSLEDDESGGESQRPTLVSLLHKMGHAVPAMLRKVPLRDSFAAPLGTALLFYPVEEVDALPHGETGEGVDVERSQADMEDRLEAAYHQWKNSSIPFGMLWITVDQAQSLRRTHGRDACEAMLRTVEQTLARQMKPTEILGRWGDNEFLVLAHERTAELLVEHARRLDGLARTADFRWWGDRVGLTASIGASHAVEGDTLQALLNRARHAMKTSAYAGGNQVTEAKAI